MLKQIGLVAALSIVLLSVAPAGSPVQVSYVHSESMEPAIGTHDGFLILPADTVEPGDIVTFHSSQRDAFVTHRIVGESDRGYMTKGDNNPTTDQAAGHAYVAREQITGEVATFRGRPIVIPNYGIAVQTARHHQIPILGALSALFIGLVVRGNASTARRSRDVERVCDVIPPLFLIAIVCATGLILWGAHVEELEFVAVQGGSPAPQTIPVGEPATTTVELERSGSAFTQTVISTRGGTLTERTTDGTTTTAQLRVPAQPTPGTHTVRVAIAQYPAVLPAELLGRLHGIHPAAAALGASTVVLAPVYVLYLLTVDGRTPIRSTRSRWLRRSREGP